MSIFGPIGFDKGLISRSSVFNTPPGALYTCNNFRSFYGSIQENYGSVSYASSTLGTGVGFCCGIFPANISTTIPVITVFDEKIYTISTTGTATDISGAAIFAATSQAQVTADVLNSIMVIGDPKGSTGWLAQWSGTGNCTKLAAAPDGRVVITVNNFMFVSYVDAAPSTVYWSSASDPTTWPGASNITFRQGDGDKIVALSYIGTDLYIFKQFSIARLSTTTQTIAGTVTLGPLQTVSVGIGAATTRSVDRLPDGRLIFWASNGHAYIFDGSTMMDISDQRFPNPSVQDLFLIIQPDLSLMSVTVYPPRSEVWFSNALQSGSIPGQQMVYNYQSNQWFYFGPPATGVMRALSNTAFIPAVDGKAISSSVSSAFIYGGDILGGGSISGTLKTLDHSGGTDDFTSQWNVSVSLGSEGRVFIPRSLVMFYRSVTSGTPTMTVSYGFDNGTIGNAKTVTTTSAYQRLVMPIVTPATSYSTIQIQVAGQSGTHGIHIEPFWFSDEVMN